MIPINSRISNLPVFILPFLIILSSIVIIETLYHTFLSAEPGPFANKLLVIELPAALLATLLVLSLFFHKQQLFKKTCTSGQLKTEDDWEKTFNTMTDFVSVHDKDFKIIKANQALCDFLGKSSGEIIGKRCYKIFHNTTKPFAGCPHKKTTETCHSVTEIINDPNIGVPLLVTCSPFFDDEETFQGSVHIARAHEPVAEQKNTVGEIIPICAGCKSIRKIGNKWVPPEDYFVRKYGYSFTHTICGNCQKKLYPEFIKF